jgi:hypothetical protein
LVGCVARRTTAPVSIVIGRLNRDCKNSSDARLLSLTNRRSRSKVVETRAVPWPQRRLSELAHHPGASPPMRMDAT